MNESGEPESGLSLGRNEQAAAMKQEERVALWMGLLPAIMAVIFAIIALIFAVHVDHLNRPGSQSSAQYFLIALAVLSLIFLCRSMPSFFEMIRREKRTGSIYCSGEELEAWRARRKKPRPLWLRAALIAIYGFEAFWFARSAIVNPGHRDLDWIVATVWLLAAASEAWDVSHRTASEKP
jgi:MFS family permease